MHARLDGHAVRQATATDKEEERAATPPPDERNFVDDDGTAYQWDPAQRRFVEMGAPAPTYGVDEMTFAVEPDVIPAMPRREVCRRQRSGSPARDGDVAPCVLPTPCDGDAHQHNTSRS